MKIVGYHVEPRDHKLIAFQMNSDESALLLAKDKITMSMRGVNDRGGAYDRIWCKWSHHLKQKTTSVKLNKMLNF